MLRTLQRERGLALLLVEHDLGMVGEVVDRTIVMNLGDVIAEGSFDAVMADPRRPPRLPGGHGMTVLGSGSRRGQRWRPVAEAAPALESRPRVGRATGPTGRSST